MTTLFAEIPLPDMLAFGFFILSWTGYVLLADFLVHGKTSLMSRMHEYRVAWAKLMIVRENRMVDIQVVNVIVSNVRFFASSTIFVIGGLVAVFGAADTARNVIAEIPFAVHTTHIVWNIKLLLLLVIFVYAFFKFTWSLRQFNYVAILIGAMPEELNDESLRCAERVAIISSRAADHFNRAMRAFYFGLAVLSWFIQPTLLIFATIWVSVIIYRREFHSVILQTLGPVGSPIGTQK